ncbi:MAG: 30S ribosomal protein S6 [Candidatus Dadabacteria bacterium]|nr:30S ribosomal protein S6 [Candidatus Dadabacteria bacterium]MYC39421.1 30S ribosomal protein S6 [Candidatus Dadabacteria bacterium]
MTLRGLRPKQEAVIMAIEPTKYETLYLVRPDISPEDLLTIQDRVEQSVAANGGEIIKSEKWAERDLAYRIDNYTRGTYYITVYASEPGAVTDIERYFNLSKNNVLRFMTVKYIEEQKPAGAVMSAPPQASGQEDQSAFQTPPLTAEEQAEESAEPSQETQEQAEESQEQPQEDAEQTKGGSES